MSNNFEKLYTLDKNLYAKGSPIIIKAGALLLNKTNGDVIVQLKIENISEQPIVAIKVAIEERDVAERIINKKFSFEYLDLSLSPNCEDGDKIPVVLDDKNTRSFNISIEEVVFKDHSTIDLTSKKFNHIEVDKPIAGYLTYKSIKEQYDKELLYANNNSKNIPVEVEDIWQCACGCVNSNNDKECKNCKNEKKKVFELCDKKLLEEKLKEDTYNFNVEKFDSCNSLEEYEKLKREFEKNKDYKESKKYIELCDKKIDDYNDELLKRGKKQKKKITISIIILVTLIISFIIGKPIYYKNQAIKYYKKGSYTKAFNYMKKSGNTKDYKLMLRKYFNDYISKCKAESRFIVDEQIIEIMDNKSISFRDADYKSVFELFENITVNNKSLHLKQDITKVFTKFLKHNKKYSDEYVKLEELFIKNSVKNNKLTTDLCISLIDIKNKNEAIYEEYTQQVAKIILNNAEVIRDTYQGNPACVCFYYGSCDRELLENVFKDYLFCMTILSAKENEFIGSTIKNEIIFPEIIFDEAINCTCDKLKIYIIDKNNNVLVERILDSNKDANVNKGFCFYDNYK